MILLPPAHDVAGEKAGAFRLRDGKGSRGTPGRAMFRWAWKRNGVSSTLSRYCCQSIIAAPFFADSLRRVIRQLLENGIGK